MRKKSPGWPQYMEQKRSGRGLRYFWNAPSWARKRGYSVKSEPLGSDYTAAKARCDDYLNPMFEAWRTGGDAKRIALAGSVDWMFAEYKGSTARRLFMSPLRSERRMLKGRESPSRAKANNTAETRKRGARENRRSRSRPCLRRYRSDSSLAAWRSHHPTIRQRLWDRGAQSRSAHPRFFSKKPKAI
jgi:hypothetical protein